MGGKTQPLLGMSKSLPSVKGTTALATKAANSGSKWTKEIAALGTAVGQGVSEPSRKKAQLLQLIRTLSRTLNMQLVSIIRDHIIGYLNYRKFMEEI